MEKMSLIHDIWYNSTEYLGPVELFNLSQCSKHFYIIVHKNKKYKKLFSHSKQIVCGVNVSLPILELVDEFLLELHSLFGFHLNQKGFLWVKKRFLMVAERILPFKIPSIFL